ncbi:PREDICTED: venom prothrombin activator vestarin-D2-like [Chaetura pelagica]|uniref:venom prothrombin activator vestarin-D2-like n=1 Tax=Chaetura pelagica TaxID=8897 RepID=UPI000523E326|nr:PREDICTED: venom prothrombin activator vestarin-D2-like [Chaetura pelagica]
MSKGSPLHLLMSVWLPLLSLESCQGSPCTSSPTTVCTSYGAAAACKGDSGGPFTMSYNTWFLLGIVSWGEGCAEEGKYSIFTRVSNYIPWIKEIVESIADLENFTINFS